jgi:serine/threonine protein kinase
MAAPATTTDFLDVVRKSRLVEEPALELFQANHPNVSDPQEIAAALKAEGLLTNFQSEQLLRGKHRGFVLGRYKLLDRIGLGGMGQVFLAEHGVMRKKVALKVLPPDRAQNQFARERFVREAQATGQLEHPNLIKAYDLDGDGDVHFLVLEYVDGLSLQEMVTRNGPIDYHRAAYYLWQAASGLAYLAGRGLIHRDIKPANLIVDRVGAIKILDLGLVRSQESVDDLTKREDVKFLGTADYLAPEQMISCSTVDTRADLYALGATGYFILTGRTPYSGTTIAQKLIAAQSTEARAVHLVNPAVPVELSVIITKLMAKKAADRYQTPAELLAVLDHWAETPPDPPPESDFPNRDGSVAAPIAVSAVTLSFNMMKAARGTSPSGNKLGSQSSSSGLRLQAEPGESQSGIPTVEARKDETNVELYSVETPNPNPQAASATPGPIPMNSRLNFKPARAALKTTSTPSKKFRGEAPPPIPVSSQSGSMKKPETRTMDNPAGTMKSLADRASRELASCHVPLTPAEPPKPRGLWGFIKSLFGG